MAKHLTDREKKKIIADYAEMGSCNAVAKKHKRSWTTVKQVVESDPDTMKKCEQKRQRTCGTCWRGWTRGRTRRAMCWISC